MSEPLGPAGDYVFLTRTPSGGTPAGVDDVFWVPPTPDGTGGWVPLFKTPWVGRAFIAEAAKRGMSLQASMTPTGDDMTSLLARLKELGVAHVVVDPGPASRGRFPIDSAIIHFQLGG